MTSGVVRLWGDEKRWVDPTIFCLQLMDQVEVFESFRNVRNLCTRFVKRKWHKCNALSRVIRKITAMTAGTHCRHDWWTRCVRCFWSLTLAMSLLSSWWDGPSEMVLPPPLPPLPLGTCSRSSSSKMASSVRQPMKTSASVACFNWIIYLKSLVKIIGPKSRKKKKGKL